MHIEPRRQHNLISFDQNRNKLCPRIQHDFVAIYEAIRITIFDFSFARISQETIKNDS
jgi:hypothetical protein